jgi:lysozyme
MSAVDLAVAKLQTLEGFRANVYDDSDGMPIITQGVPTIGFGCACRDWPIALASSVLQWQVDALNASLNQLPWFIGLDDARQAVLITLAFNLGFNGLIRGFPKMIAAIQAGNWAEAQNQCQVTEPQLKSRYDWAGTVLFTGSWT